MEVEAEFQEITVIQAVPGHPEVLAGYVLSRAFPGFDTETSFADHFFIHFSRGQSPFSTHVDTLSLTVNSYTIQQIILPE